MIAPTIKHYAQQLGAMRVVLGLSTLIVIVLAPAAGTRATAEGWAFVPTLLVPVLAPLILMLLLLDALMGAVFMSDKTGDERVRYRNVVRFNLIMAALLFLYWLPYFLALGKPATG